MKSFTAFIFITLFSALIFFGLYIFDAHNNFRDIKWAIAISIVLLITHMTNFIIYFKTTGNDPYRWSKYKKR